MHWQAREEAVAGLQSLIDKAVVKATAGYKVCVVLNVALILTMHVLKQ